MIITLRHKDEHTILGVDPEMSLMYNNYKNCNCKAKIKERNILNRGNQLD